MPTVFLEAVLSEQRCAGNLPRFNFDSSISMKRLESL